MAQQTIGIGSSANDGTGDPLRTAFTKINANFTELYGSTAEANDIIEDTSPQLGGTLDLNGQVIDFKPEEPASNINSVGANTTTTLVSTRNYMLAGVITVADTYTWDVAGTGTLTII